MAHIENPDNLDDDDDAIFAGALMDGRIWIEDDDDDSDDNVYYTITDDVLEEARDFIHERTEEWVDFSRLCQHLHEMFDELEPGQLGEPNKKHKSLLKFFADYPSDFDLRQDDTKKGVYLIRVKQNH